MCIRDSPRWSGAALIDANGGLVGVGSLLVRETLGGKEINANMFVPVDLLKPILGDLTARGRAARAARPWLGIYAAEARGQVYVTGVVNGGPAQRADIREGDRIDRVAEQQVTTLPELYRSCLLYTSWRFRAGRRETPESSCACAARARP